MLDIKLIRDKPDFIKAELAKRCIDPAEVDSVLEADAVRRKLQANVDEMRADRKRRSREIGKLPPEERAAAIAQIRQEEADEDRASVLANAVEAAAAINSNNPITLAAAQLALAEREVERLAMVLPNIPRPYVVVGASEADNRVLRTEGTPSEFTSFKPLPHWELGEKLGIIDFDRGVKLSGTRFYVLMGLGARLQRALIAWMLDLKTIEQGYLEVIPPLMVNTETATSTGHLPKNADTMYHDAEDDFWFIPTAEVPLTSLHRNEVLDESRLPIYLTAYTPCFRREKMSAGRDVRGIKRGHQFDKVEMVKLVKPETSDDEFNKMVDNAAEICRRLKIPFRVVELCTADLSFASAVTYDLEMWAPGCGEWLEVSSISNCTDFQARRARIRYRSSKGGKLELVHTLNGSGLALPRTVIAILENYQNEDGSVTIPEILRPYMGGVERITKA
ncbi:MAG: serine--tRNA ligase [Candidatus Binatus sp.]|uniref:serine--tRNA ligase n=1 Tax=Candidatus Binatus sp. TaxID=2811406 RepID=UPI0027209E3B|nr:serine--tRNA ligase [Candidatus Binatus sp.]MDO8433453.1 serine--tRNA ligase [Candidatus Binatus sp.]